MMSVSLLSTKLYVPDARPNGVSRPRLIEQLNEGLSASRKLTLISAPAGFGKTTLVSEWITGRERPVAWLSLDEGDNDPIRFLAYLVAAVQTIAADIGETVLAALQSPQLPPTESLLTSLLNDIATKPGSFILVLDDYHVIDSQPVDEALVFLVEHLPPQMHLVIATREDPHLPLARLRARGQLTELRAADLRFTASEAAEFLNRVMGLGLSGEDISVLEARTEGWIAGLQLAAVSMQGHKNATGFIKSFTGSHRFVLDYLVEEVLGQQSESVQTFLLRTSILDRMCGSLCDAVLLDPSAPGQETLEYLEHANLFVIPLDNERRWYRYHHLFAELLRQRLQQSDDMAGLHLRASQWYEDQGLELEAFRHAVAANDVERAGRLIRERGMPVHSLPVATAILDWLDSLPKPVLDARPWLWVRSATSTLMAGQITGVEEKLQAAEEAMQAADLDDKTRDLIGQIAAIRATLALLQSQPDATIMQSQRALEYLRPDNLPFRSRANWALGFGYNRKGDRTSARQMYTEAIRQASGNIYYTVLATTSLGQLQESENQLYQAAEIYQRSLQLLGDLGPPNASEEYIGLARIFYEWNDLDTAEQYGLQGLQLAQQYDRAIDRFIICEVGLARIKLAQGDVSGAAAMLAQAQQSACQGNFTVRLPEIAAAQVPILLRQGQIDAAAQLAQQHELPLSLARVLLSQEDPAAALEVLEPFRQQMEAKGWADEQLKAMVLQAVALYLDQETARAVQVLGEALALAEPGGFIRIFVDEGAPMAKLLLEAASQGVRPDYISKLLAVFEAEKRKSEGKPQLPPAQFLIESLSQRELKILQLIALGLSNREIGERLYLALDTVKGYNRRIFDKLQVHSRTEVIARAHELGLL
jgi:LuxR family maltose regulon positive regulatory protein